jgi:hypothetical protein
MVVSVVEVMKQVQFELELETGTFICPVFLWAYYLIVDILHPTNVWV